MTRLNSQAQPLPEAHGFSPRHTAGESVSNLCSVHPAEAGVKRWDAGRGWQLVGQEEAGAPLLLCPGALLAAYGTTFWGGGWAGAR